MNKILMIVATVVAVIGFVAWGSGAEKPWPSALFAISSILSGISSYIGYRKIKKMREQGVGKLIICLSIEDGGPCIIHPEGMPGCKNTREQVIH